MTNRCDYAETFPATLDTCNLCGGKDVNIASISYGDKVATAIYVCKNAERHLNTKNTDD